MGKNGRLGARGDGWIFMHGYFCKTNHLYLRDELSVSDTYKRKDEYQNIRRCILDLSSNKQAKLRDATQRRVGNKNSQEKLIVLGAKYTHC